MGHSGFGSDDIVNRRVNKHLTALLPTQVSADQAYHLEGQRTLPAAAVPSHATTGQCFIESYVGPDGHFEIHQQRVFDHETDTAWRIENRISRQGSGSLPPFTYLVRTRITVMGETRTDRARVPWADLDDDPIYGGREAQAAVLLSEKMAHLLARDQGKGMTHSGSLSRLGSLSNVIDEGRQLRTDWAEMNDLLGPDADTIAATSGFERLESSEKRRAAKQKGIEFLDEDAPARLADRRAESGQPTEDDQSRERASWETPPSALTVAETNDLLRTLQARIRRMQTELNDSHEE